MQARQGSKQTEGHKVRRAWENGPSTCRDRPHSRDAPLTVSVHALLCCKNPRTCSALCARLRDTTSSRYSLSSSSSRLACDSRQDRQIGGI
jgi:hypothetical protein